MTNVEAEIRSITAYPYDVVEGRIVACEYVKLACQRFIDQCHDERYEFKPEKVEKVINFVGKMKHFSSSFAGKPFTLLDWEKFALCASFGLYHRGTDLRLVHHVYISVARKNAKSSLIAAAFGLYALIADGENDAQVLLAANSFQQSQILFKMCSLYLKSLGSQVSKYFKMFRDTIKFNATNSMLRCVSSDSSKLDGYNPSMAIIDEYHAAPDSSMYDVLQSGQGARQNPMLVVITTAGFNTYSPCADMEKKNKEMLHGTREDESTFALIYTLDEGDDWEDENVWIKANPSLGSIVRKDFLKEQVQKAKNDPVAEIGVKTKNMNQWVQSATGWIVSDYILKASQRVHLEEYDGQYCYIALDLSSTDDLTALSVLIPQDDKYVYKNYAFVPEEQLKRSVNKDLYLKWKKRGELIVTPGNVCDYDYIINKIIETNNVVPIAKISYDMWNSTFAVTKLTELGFNCVPYSQSIGSLNRPTKEIKRLFLKGDIILDDNECTRWCISNAVVKFDSNDNEKVIKLHNDSKIDVAVAMIMALGGWLTDQHYDNEISGCGLD